jgi:hypothetical protein
MSPKAALAPELLLLRSNRRESFRFVEQKTMSAPTSSAASSIVGASDLTNVPTDKALKHAAVLAIQHDKPILLDYFNDTRDGKAFLGEDATTKEKMLVRSEEEYTSLVQGMWRAGKEAGNDFIVMTENSIYIISGNTRKKTISAPTA